MSLASRIHRPLFAAGIAIALSLGAAISATAQTSDQTPTYPNDVSAAGLHALLSQDPGNPVLEGALPPEVLERVRDFVRETRARNLDSRNGLLSIMSGAPLNVRANDPTGDRVGETQAEVAIAVDGNKVVVGWNDSRGFLAGNTVTSFAYSTDGGATFTDGGNMPLALATDQAFGDPGLDTDGIGNWYMNQIYTRAAGAPSPTAEQNIAVHHGTFNGLGQLIWDPPTMASIGTAATGNLDKCLLATDRVTGNVYVSYTRFTSPSQIEIVRSTTLGATWGAPIVLDNTTLPTSSKQSARPFCGPGGEVYVVWEKGANTIYCPDGTGLVGNPNGEIAFTRSLNFGVSYDPYTVIGYPGLTFMAAGPGDLRERGNEFPDIAVDRTGGPYNGNLYVTWHEAAPWSSNLSAGAVRAEAADAANNNPGGAELFVVGENVTGSISTTADFDYWQFSATQGQSYLINLDPQGFNCGVSGTTRGMRLRLFASQSPYPNPTGFPDSLLAASAQGTFAQRIVWTCPKTATYLLRLQTSTTAIGTYLLRARTLAFSGGTASRDARDVVLVQSSDQGLTWTVPRLLNDDAAGLENRRPFVTVDGIGNVHVFWHDSRVPGFGSNAALANIFGTTSRDGGATWNPNFCVTDELSFFSFNTLAVPNLGDYNQAAGNAIGAIPAWSDQRVSTGDVRTPGTNTFTAGLGPEAYTARVTYTHAVTCPGDFTAVPGPTAMTFRVTNSGSVPDRYDYSVTDDNAWLSGGPVTGTTPMLAPSSFFDVFVTLDVPVDCMPTAADIVHWTARPVGDPDGLLGCNTTVTCDNSTATLVSGFWAEHQARAVALRWISYAVQDVRSWNVYRSSQPDRGFVRLNADAIAMAAGGSFSFVDGAPLEGTAYYRLTGQFADGSEHTMETVEFTSAGLVRTAGLRLAGRNPFSDHTTLLFTVPQRSDVSIDVYSITGQRVRSVASGMRDPGTYTEPFALRDGSRRLGAGVYLVRMLMDGKLVGSMRLIALE